MRSTDDEDTVAEIKVYIIQFLLRCLKTPGVNIAYYLLGFNLESIKTTILRQPGTFSLSCFAGRSQNKKIRKKVNVICAVYKNIIILFLGYNYPRTCLHSIFLLLNTSLSERRDKIDPLHFLESDCDITGKPQKIGTRQLGFSWFELKSAYLYGYVIVSELFLRNVQKFFRLYFSK